VLCSRAFSVTKPQAWNRLSTSPRHNVNAATFKEHLKQHLLLRLTTSNYFIFSWYPFYIFTFDILPFSTAVHFTVSGAKWCQNENEDNQIEGQGDLTEIGSSTVQRNATCKELRLTFNNFKYHVVVALVAAVVVAAAAAAVVVVTVVVVVVV